VTAAHLACLVVSLQKIFDLAMIALVTFGSHWQQLSAAD